MRFILSLKKINLSWIFSLELHDHFTVNAIVMSCYFSQVSTINIAKRTVQVEPFETSLWEHVSNVEFLVCPFSFHHFYCLPMFDFSGYRNNHFHALSMNNAYLNEIDDTLLNSWVSTILHGPYHMVHIIWSISYGPYYMVHIRWTICIDYMYSNVAIVPDLRLVRGMITLPFISIIWANKVWLYVGTQSKSIIVSAFPGMKTLVVLKRKS